ncbi:MAG: hypothetical protein WCT10_01995 [Patescibacteria group bacterium]|jgi:hypothetical protein
MKITTKGTDQQGCVGEPLQPLQVWLKEECGLINMPVHFRLIKGRGKFTHRDERTDWSGEAIAEFIPEAAGPYTIDCLIGRREQKGQTMQKVSFTGQISPAAPPKSDFTSDISQMIDEELAVADQSKVSAPATESPAPTSSFETLLAAELAVDEDLPPAEQIEPVEPQAPPPPETPPAEPETEPLSKPVEPENLRDREDNAQFQNEDVSTPNWKQKIVWAVMALAIGGFLAIIANLDRKGQLPTAGNSGTGSIDCTQAAVQVVDGDKFVFSGCVKQP